MAWDSLWEGSDLKYGMIINHYDKLIDYKPGEDENNVNRVGEQSIFWKNISLSKGISEFYTLCANYDDKAHIMIEIKYSISHGPKMYWGVIVRALYGLRMLEEEKTI